MPETQETTYDPVAYLSDQFWACLPEKTADELATFKKDVLTGIKNAVGRFVDDEIAWTDERLENARRIREEDEQAEAETPPPTPA
jgi:gas vesicle protein